VTFVETLVKYGKVMQNLPKIRALLEVKIGHFVSPLFLKKMWAPYIKLLPIILKYVCRIYSEDIIISKRCLF
jgi:hypothetical protein